MKKKILITSTDVMMIQFLVPHVLSLVEQGYCVDVGCSNGAGYKEDDFLTKIQDRLPQGSHCFKISTQRSPFSIKNFKGYKDLRRIIGCGKYDLIWTNEPVMGVLTRLAAKKTRKNGTKVLYIAHGLHFFKGAPKKNWIYYIIEKYMARFCDCIATINWEDYNRVRDKIKKNVFHINGIGVDLDRFSVSALCTDKNEKRVELGIENNVIVIVSVGELLRHKNHETIIRALSKIDNNMIKYIICGKGDLGNYLKELAEKLGISDKVCFLGHRSDIPDILNASDIFAHPSTREGLGVAAIEAMSMGLPLVTSNVHGIKDYMTNGENGFTYSPTDVEGFAQGIKLLIEDEKLRSQIGENNMECSKKYSISSSKQEVLEMIEKILKGEMYE